MTHLWGKHINEENQMGFFFFGREIFGALGWLMLKEMGNVSGSVDVCHIRESITHRAGLPVIETLQLRRFAVYCQHQTLCWSVFILHSARDQQQKKLGLSWAFVSVVCTRFRECVTLGMTNLAVSASLLHSLAWSFNPHICMAKHRSASTQPHWISTRGI